MNHEGLNKSMKNLSGSQTRYLPNVSWNYFILL